MKLGELHTGEQWPHGSSSGQSSLPKFQLGRKNFSHT